MSEKVICPACQKLFNTKKTNYEPFCSERCQMIDLGKWAKEEYKLASDEVVIEQEKLNN